MTTVNGRESAAGWEEHGPRIVGLVVLVLALAQQAAGAIPGTYLVDGLNLSAAVSLARGSGLAFAHLPGTPDAATWLPAYPAVLSVVVRMWPDIPDNITLIQLVNALSMAGAAWALSASFRQIRFPPLFFDVAVLLAFWNPRLLGLTTYPFGEALFLLLVFTGIGLIDRPGSGVRTHAVAGVLVTFAALTVVPGSVALAAAVAAPLIRRQWRPAVAVLIPAGVLVGAWRGITERGSGLVSTSLALARDYDPQGEALGSLVSGGWHGLAVPVSGLMLALFVWGVLVLARQRPAFVVAATGMLAFVLVWPDPPTRWSAACLPFLLPPAAVGLRRAWGVHRRARLPVLAVLLLWLGAYGAPLVRGTVARTVAQEGADARERYAIALASVAQELPADAVVATDADAMVFLMTGRRAVPVHGLELDGGVSGLCEQGATHVLWLGVGGERPAALASGSGDDGLAPLFEMAGGPALFALSCAN